MAPLPTKIIGALLPLTSAAAALMRSGSGLGAGNSSNGLAGPAGGAGVAIGHVAAGLLVPGADHLELGLMEGVEQAVDLRAGEAEHGVDAMRHEAIDDCFAAGS